MSVPVTITNLGSPVTNAPNGVPVTLVGGTVAALGDQQVATGVLVDGVSKTVTFTVVDGRITEITTA